MNLRDFKYAFRSINKNLLNSIIIVISIAVGLACTNLISVFVLRELQHDDFHKNKDRIYILQTESPMDEGEMTFNVPTRACEYIIDNYPEVEDYCRLTKGKSKKVIAGNNTFYNEVDVLWTSDNFFSFFTFDLVSGNPQTVLESDNKIIISEKLAEKYFGTSDAIGNKISLQIFDSVKDFFVSGVFKKPKEASHVNFDMVTSYGQDQKYWLKKCYLQLRKNAQIGRLHKKLEADKEHLPNILGVVNSVYTLLPFKEVYFKSEDSFGTTNHRERKDILISVIIALVILVIATFNYLGLLNNLLLNRMKEVSIRKINGLSTSQQIISLLLEYSILIFAGLLLSILLIAYAFPNFKELVSSDIELEYLYNLKSILLMAGFVLLLVISTLIFIIFFLKRTKLAEAIKSKPHLMKGKQTIPAFNIFQFAATIVLIIASVSIVQQIYFITQKDIGIDKNVISTSLPGHTKQKASVIKDELLKSPLVESVSVTGSVPLIGNARVIAINYFENGIKKHYSPYSFSGDNDILKTLDLNIIGGSSFSSDNLSKERQCLINRSLAKKFAPDDLIGKSLPGLKSHKVIGIVEDFHYSSLKDKIEPAYISVNNSGQYLLIKGSTDNNALLAQEVKKIYESIVDDYPFEYTTIGEKYDTLHADNIKLVKLIGSCAAISIFLSLIGLFAISLHSIQLRVKEIGVRKVNGARVSEILQLLNSDFIKWVGIAYLIATPVAYYALNSWLENFAYKIKLDWWIFALSGALAIGIALLTVSWQSWKAATRNPVEALRYE